MSNVMVESNGLGATIRKARTALRFSLQDVADAIHYNRTSLCRIELGVLIPTSKRLKSICGFLGLDYKVLLSKAWTAKVNQSVGKYLKDQEKSALDNRKLYKSIRAKMDLWKSV